MLKYTFILLLMFFSTVSIVAADPIDERLLKIDNLFSNALKMALRSDAISCSSNLHQISHHLDMLVIESGNALPKILEYKSYQTKSKLILSCFKGSDTDDESLSLTTTARDLLLELTGQFMLVDKKLASIEPFGMCGNAMLSDEASAFMERADIFLRLGKWKTAEKHMARGIELSTSAWGPISRDWNALRHGFLLSKLHRKNDSNSRLLRIIDLHPKSEFIPIAVKMLKKSNSLLPPSSLRLKQYFTGPYRHQAIFALAEHKFDESLNILREQLLNADECERNCIIPALGILGNKDAIPVLEKAFLNGTKANMRHAAKSLVKLGELQYLPHYLALWRSEIIMSNDPPRLQKLLLTLYPDGPVINVADDSHSTLLADSWTKWSIKKLAQGRTPKKGWLSDLPRVPFRKPVLSLNIIVQAIEKEKKSYGGDFRDFMREIAKTKSSDSINNHSSTDS